MDKATTLQHAKAYVGLCIPLVMVGLSWFATGELNSEEMVLAVTGVLVGLGVYTTPNTTPRHQDVVSRDWQPHRRA